LTNANLSKSPCMIHLNSLLPKILHMKGNFNKRIMQ